MMQDWCEICDNDTAITPGMVLVDQGNGTVICQDCLDNKVVMDAEDEEKDPETA